MGTFFGAYEAVVAICACFPKARTISWIEIAMISCCFHNILIQWNWERTFWGLLSTKSVCKERISTHFDSNFIQHFQISEGVMNSRMKSKELFIERMTLHLFLWFSLVTFFKFWIQVAPLQVKERFFFVTLSSIVGSNHYTAVILGATIFYLNREKTIGLAKSWQVIRTSCKKGNSDHTSWNISCH